PIRDSVLKKQSARDTEIICSSGLLRDDGKVYNITAGKEKLKQVEQRLLHAVRMYRRRMEWLTSESRRIFGVIYEHSVCIILDIKNMSPRAFDTYLCAAERVLKEQIIHKGQITRETVQNAIDWLWQLDRLAPTSPTDTVEGVIRAAADPDIEAIYLFTRALRQMLPVKSSSTRGNSTAASPAGGGIRADVFKVCRGARGGQESVAQVQHVLANTPDPQASKESPVERDTVTAHERKEEYMKSSEWLQRFGIVAKKLDFFDILAGLIQPKLINARYCDRFAHVLGKDGTVLHVQVTPELHRIYEERMNVCLESIQRRIDWLREGSRELFGTIVEDQHGAEHRFVKDKLYILIQEQLRHKLRVNFVAFNTKAYPWKDRLVEVTEQSLQTAWNWIKPFKTVLSQASCTTACQFTPYRSTADREANQFLFQAGQRHRRQANDGGPGVLGLARQVRRRRCSRAAAAAETAATEDGLAQSSLPAFACSMAWRQPASSLLALELSGSSSSTARKSSLASYSLPMPMLARARLYSALTFWRPASASTESHCLMALLNLRSFR
uniref:DNA_MISMATCH_REPAIR_2 domain-containing protein n=1 Tax=Macrostomum lignano TaxID=282301 RepID=A0A1I8FMI0_9PLAT